MLIDQESDAEATIVEISFGDRLGALLDTVGYYFHLLHYLSFGFW